MTSCLHISLLAARRRRQAESARLTRTQHWAWRVGIPIAGSGRSGLLLAVRAYWATVGVLNIHDILHQSINQSCIFRVVQVTKSLQDPLEVGNNLTGISACTQCLCI